MRKTERAIVSVVAAALMIFVGAASVPAQDQGRQQPGQQQPSQQQSQQMTVQGELVQVDTETRMIVVRANNTPMSFRYNEKTEVSGAQESIAGLATTRGSRVTVHYTEDAGIRTATKIEVQAESQGQGQGQQQPQQPQR